MATAQSLSVRIDRYIVKHDPHTLNLLCLFHQTHTYSPAHIHTRPFSPTPTAFIPFKDIEPYTAETKDDFIKKVKKAKKQLPGAITEAEADLAKPKEDRAPGPPDTKTIRKREREEKRKAKELEKKRKQEEDKLKKKTKKKKQQQKKSKADGAEEGGSGKKKGKEKKQGSKKRGRDAEAEGEKKKKKAKVGGAASTSTSEEGGKVKKMKKDFERESEDERFIRLSRNLKFMLEDESPNVPKICSTLVGNKDSYCWGKRGESLDCVCACVPSVLPVTLPPWIDFLTHAYAHPHMHTHPHTHKLGTGEAVVHRGFHHEADGDRCGAHGQEPAQERQPRHPGSSQGGFQQVEGQL